MVNTTPRIGLVMVLSRVCGEIICYLGQFLDHKNVPPPGVGLTIINRTCLQIGSSLNDVHVLLLFASQSQMNDDGLGGVSPQYFPGEY